MPTSADEVKNLSDDELHFVFALTYATEIRAVVDNGDEALRSEVESWTPKTRAHSLASSLRSAEPRPRSDIGLTRRSKASVHP